MLRNEWYVGATGVATFRALWQVTYMSSNLRKKPRRALTHKAVICDRNGTPIVDCVLRDISETGGRLSLQTDRDLPAEFLLVLAQQGRVRRHCRTVWRQNNEMGVQFLMPG